MRIISSFLLLLFSFLTLHICAQERPVIRVYISDKTEIIEGKKFYLHTVEKGQTLYAIAVAYGASVDAIAKENAIKDNLIGVGEVLRIPYTTQQIVREVVEPQKVQVDTSKYIVHRVLKGETLFSLSKMYNVPISLIETHNPLLADGLKADTDILIPKIEFKPDVQVAQIEETLSIFDEPDTASYFIHIVQRRETLFSISNLYVVPIKDIIDLNPGAEEGIKNRQELRIPKEVRFQGEQEFVDVEVDTVKAVKEKQPVFTNCSPLEKKRTLEVALLIPLYLSEVSDINTNFSSHAYQRDRNNVIRAFTYLQFYQGFVMAIDSLRKSGLSLNLYVYDVTEDVQQARAFISRADMKKLDLIIGPFHNDAFAIVANFAADNNIKIINPILSGGHNYTSKGNLINIPLTARTQLEQYVRHLMKKHKDNNILIVHNNTSQERNLISIFKNHWATISKDSLFPIKELIYNQSGLTGIVNNLRKNKENIILSFSTNEAFVSNFIRQLSGIQEKDSTISLFGLPSWQNFNNLELAYLEKLNYRYFSVNYTDYENSNVVDFIKKFREEYAIEPDNYAYIGYDIGMYFLYAFNEFGGKFTDCINDIPVSVLNADFKFRYNTTTRSYDNTYLNFLRYKDYRVLKE